MKYYFRGDPEYQRESYWNLPYEYIVLSIKELNKLRQQELHEYERPIAVLALQQAELNRDRKKKKNPYKIEEFYLYMDSKIQKLPSSRYAACFMELLRLGLCPNWALFIYKDLVNISQGINAPDEIALIHEDCIILGPDFNEGECRGMLIATEAASGCILEFKSTLGHYVTMKVPVISAKVIADEEACLQLYR